MEIKKYLFKEAVDTVISRRNIRKVAVRQLDKILYKGFINSPGTVWPSMKIRRYEFMSSILHTISKNLDNGNIKPEVAKKMARVFIGDSLKADRHEKLNDAKQAFKEKYGEYPPLFCVLSPTQACNLRCTGCYAVSDQTTKPTLEYEYVEKIISQVHDVLGGRFMTISGGEPFLYKNKGRMLWDIWERFNDMFFLVYTNGTLITREVAERLAELGNVTLAISVEGFEKETDERRGKGTFKKILEAMANLRAAGVPFGISVTATSKNVDLLLEDEFYEFFFKEHGISYMWQFQMMPIGRGKEIVDLMIKPEERVALYHKWKELIGEKRYPVADFWNSGALTEGCLAYGRWGGYFYIDWNGNVMPCVFVPFYKHNVKDLFKEGLTIGDALFSDFFKNGREWQKEYGFDHPEKRKNILMPCSIKDHFNNFRENIITDDVKPENDEAAALLEEGIVVKVLRNYEAALEAVTQRVYEEDYLYHELKEPKEE